MSFCRYVVSVALLALIAVVLRSQTSSQTAAPDANSKFQAKVRVVVEDVVVTDAKGEPVPGLRKEDFEISEESVPQSIATCEEHKAATLSELKLPPMPPNVYTNFPLIQKADSLNVLLLDSMNTQLRDQTYVHQQMIKYLGTIPPGTRVAIFTLASRLRMLQGVTTDSSQLLAVLNDKKGAAGPHQSPVLDTPDEDQSLQYHVNFMSTENGFGSATAPANLALAAVDPVNALKQFMADTMAFQTEVRTRLTLLALQQLARYLSDTPGRKNVIWFSGSFPIGILPDSDLVNPLSVVRNFEEEIRKTTDLLASSQMAIYPISAEGLVTQSVYEANAGEISTMRPSNQSRQVTRQMRSEDVTRDSSRAAMKELAHETGGEAFYNTNGLNDVLNRVINNGTRYYTLTYTPTNTNMNGKFRRIEVKLRDSKYKLAYRRGYFADPTGGSPQHANVDPLLPLMGRNFPDLSQIVYKVSVVPSKPQPGPDTPLAGTNTDLKGPLTRYAIDFAVAVQDLKLDPTPDGGRHGNLEVMLVAYDREGKPLNMVLNKSDLVFPPKIYAGMQKLGLQLHSEIDVPKEDVYLRTGIYDPAADAAGTLGFPLPAQPTTPATAAK
jgi:VWFA-related protein